MRAISLPALYIGEEIVSLISQSGPVAKAILLILLAFSVLSWAIILSKWAGLKRARAQSGRFLRAFSKSRRLQDVAAISEQFRPSPLVAVFDGGFEEIRRQGGIPRNVTAMQRAMQIAASEELSRLESRLTWLATTGATAPFVGLFGTV